MAKTKTFFSRVKPINTDQGKAYALCKDTFFGCMENWLTNNTRICLKLRSSSSHGNNRNLEVSEFLKLLMSFS